MAATFTSPLRVVTIRHWLPIVTLCPVNRLPDLIYVSVTYKGDELVELYAERKRIRKLVTQTRMRFMEDIAQHLMDESPRAASVTVRLALNRHIVTYHR